MNKQIGLASAVFLLLASADGRDAIAQDSSQVLRGSAAFGGIGQDRPGLRRHITAADLPPPGKSTSNTAEVVPMPAGAKPRVPSGFSVDLVASGLSEPRVIRTAPNGDVFVAESRANRVRILKLSPGSAKPARNEVFADGLNRPYGIAFYPLGPNPQWIYIANTDGVVRFPYHNGDLRATGRAEHIVEHIPTTHHWTRDIACTPDGRRMLFTVGSGSNVALDMAQRPQGGLEAWKMTRPLGAAWDTEERRANVLSFDPDGKNEKILATGLRNCTGITFEPVTGKPWCVVNERDEIGDDTPFEYATEVKEGAFYGWPWYYIGGHEDPRLAGARPDLKNQVTTPDVFMQAHSAPLQIAFYEGNSFPPEYKGSAFVTMHGSWNRAQPTGYKVVRLFFDGNGKPTGEYEDFVTGFAVSGNQVWGRPVGVTVTQDGSLLVTEDGNGTIWRVSHQTVASR